MSEPNEAGTPVVAMTPAALNAEIARRLGWTEVSSHGEVGYPPGEVGQRVCCVPRWTKNLGAAWELIKAGENHAEPALSALRWAQWFDENPHWYLHTAPQAALLLCQAFYFSWTGTRVEVQE